LGQSFRVASHRVQVIALPKHPESQDHISQGKEGSATQAGTEHHNHGNPMAVHEDDVFEEVNKTSKINVYKK